MLCCGALRQSEQSEDSKKAAAKCPKTGPPLARAPAPTVRAPKLTINCRLVKLPGLRATIEVRLVYYKTIAQPLAGAARTARPSCNYRTQISPDVEMTKY